MGSKKVELSEVAEIIMGQSPKGETYNNYGDGYPLLNGPSEFGEIYPIPEKWTTDPKRFSKEGDILFCVRGSTGRMNWSDRDYSIGRGLCAIRAKTEKQIDTYYIYYSLLSNLTILLNRGTGSVFPNLSKRDIHTFNIVWPQKSIRRDIAKKLRDLDDKIGLNQRMNGTLEAIARAIFKSWFVDFDPVRAKMAGEPYPLPGEIMALFPDELVESELGMIPKGWEVLPLPEVIDFLEGPGIRNWQYTNSDEGIKFINIRCIKNHDLVLDTANRITTEEAFGKYSHFNLQKDDLVISTSGTLGRFAIVREEHLPLILNTSVIRMRPMRPNCTLAFLRGYVETYLQRELEIRASGSVQRNFGPTHLKQIKMIIPEKIILEMHNKYMEKNIRKSLQIRRESGFLTKIRDCLFQSLIY